MQFIPQLLQASLVFRDRERSEAALTLWYDAASSLSELLAALWSDTRFAAVSDATLCGIRLDVEAIAVDDRTPIGSSLEAGVLLFASTGEKAGSILVPGMQPQYYEQLGCFAQYRVDKLHPDIVALSEALQAAGICTPDGEPLVVFCGGIRAYPWNDVSRRSG